MEEGWSEAKDRVMPGRAAYLRALSTSREKGLGRPELPEPPRVLSGEVDWWKVFRNITSPMCRSYLENCALFPFASVPDNFRRAGSRAKKHFYKNREEWAYRYAGFVELEIELRMRPEFAAWFVAMRQLPGAMATAGKMSRGEDGVTGKARSDALRILVGIATSKGPDVREHRQSPRVTTGKDIDSLVEHSEGKAAANIKQRYGLGV